MSPNYDSERSGSLIYNQSRSLIRLWNGLSRLQRNLVSFLFSLVLFGCICVIVLHKEKPDDAGSNSGLSNLNKLLNDRLRHDPTKHLPDLTNLDAASARNRVEAVQNKLDQKKNLDFDANQHVDRNEDKAVEDRDFENYEGKIGESNVAEEKDDEDLLDLPLADGSIQFSGPTNDRQKAVVSSFKFAWDNYKRFSWGHDHLRPISKSGQNWFGLGLTIVDSLDTMYIMNLKEDFKEARDWVEDKLNFAVNKDVNLFETTIRVLGGLLSTFHLSADSMFLDKAKDLADRLMGAVKTPSGIPYSDVNLLEARGHSPKWSPDSSTSEVTTIQLEFKDLSRCTGDDKYENAVKLISDKIHALEKNKGLVPIFINPNTGKFRRGATITMGARGDSYYEYLLKQWVQTGKTQDYLKLDFLDSMQGVAEKLTKRTLPNRLLFIGELISGKTFKPKMDELACFLPGTLALAAHHGLTSSGTLPPVNGDDAMPKILPNNNMLMQLAEELAYTCYLTFARQPTFLAPEITHFNHDDATSRGSDDFYVKPADSHYLLRPETIESLWYLYYVTGNKTYQDWGWNIFQGIEKYTKVRYGYSSIGNVKNALDLRHKDMMESFFLGETLKYLYLLFSDKKDLDLKQWVFNTEAHPLPIRPN